MKKIVMLFIGSCFFANCLLAQTEAANNSWPAVTKEARPWTRWWWMGNAVDNENTARLLDTYSKAGFGGVEVTPVYGATGYENRYLQFLSPQWISALNFTIGKAKSLNMGVDMITGTGWPFGGPQITTENAAAKLIIQSYKLTAGQSLVEKIVPQDPKQSAAMLQAVTAYSNSGEVIDLGNKVASDGTLNWKPEKGNWDIYAAFSGYTLMKVKRAAPGGEGYVMDHFSKKAVDTYLKRFDDAFAVNPPQLNTFFNDSYEVARANWSPQFFQEFLQRRGYDLRLHLRELNSDEKTEAIGRIKADYRETLSDMLLHNFTENWTNWAHQHHSITRNQAHGSPGNLLDLYGAADIPESEGVAVDFNKDPRSDDFMLLKFASSAANAYGKPFASNETFTWFSEHFSGALSQYKPGLERVFLAGINHVFFHGTTYSPQDIPFPGWLFYASTDFVPDNSWWPHLAGMNNYITRCQSILQSGKSDNELMLYWPVYDIWSNPAATDFQLLINDLTWLQPTEFYKTAKVLQNAGYSLDFVSDKMLSTSQAVNGEISTAAVAENHKALLIPACNYMPLATLDRIIDLARSGATVIFQQLPRDVPGLNDLVARQQTLKKTLATLNFNNVASGVQKARIGNGQVLLCADVEKALTYSKITGEDLVTTGLKFIRRQIPNGKYYYLVNHTDKAVDANIPLNFKAATVLVLDPQSGSYGMAVSSVEGGKTTVHVQLQPGETWFLKATAAPQPTEQIVKWKYIKKTGAPINMENNWTLHFMQGGPQIPADQEMSKLTFWTDLPDPAMQSFSGIGEYSTTFDMPGKKAGDYILDLNNIRESAHVYINGSDAGIFWSMPFSARVGALLKPGKNTIRIQVANLMANRVRYMDQNGIKRSSYHDIGFINNHYKPFDASKWQVMPSGLMGPVTLTPVD